MAEEIKYRRSNVDELFEPSTWKVEVSAEGVSL